MVSFQYSTIDKYIVRAKCISPLHIGSSSKEDNRVLIHPVSRLPFIQASGIAGALREASERENGRDVTDRLFGHGAAGEKERAIDAASRVRISDGIFDRNTVKMEMRPRVRIDAETGTVSSGQIAGSEARSGHKFETESIGKGSEFEFSLYLFDSENRDPLEKTLGALASGQVQFGGLKSNGGGFILPVSILHTVFDLTEGAGRKKWAAEEEMKPGEYTDLTEQLKKNAGGQFSYEVTVTGKTESGILVKGIAVTEYGKNAPDSMNLRDAGADFIVPGSSLKGVLRSRMTYIAEQIGCMDVITDAFGLVSEDGKNGKDGNLTVLDTVIGSREKNESAPIQHRIHIDKFTAGVIHGGLFSQKNAYGDLKMVIRIADKRDPQAVLALLLFALRDLAAGVMNIGSGYSIGNGFIDVEEIKVCSVKDGKTAVIRPKQAETAEDPDGILSSCLKKLEGRR